MAGPTPPSVLIVEDERGLADLYAQWLDTDYTIEIAYTGESAMEKLSEEVDVVLLDRRMPGVSGDHVLDRIREQQLDCRIVMVSAVEPDFDVIALGFDDYIVKPVAKADLIDAVERMEKRMNYDTELQDYFALVSKKATLEVEKRHQDLEQNEEYRQLLDEIETLRDRVDTSLSALDQDDLRAVLRDTTNSDGSDQMHSGS